MGNDEHGPAYPEPYACPTCGDGDRHQYIICNHPLCPDGRDEYGERISLRKLEREIEMGKRTAFMEVFEPTEPPIWARVLSVAAVIVCLLWLMWPLRAPAMNHGFNPDAPLTKWFESKIRPDSPPNSCCGKGDAYPVSRVKRNTDHTWSVWLEDGSAIKYPDGTTREYFDKNTEIIVPDNKVNPPDDDLDNPTDVGWLFMRVSTPTDVGTIYCLIIHPEGN